MWDIELIVIIVWFSILQITIIKIDNELGYIL